MKDTINPEETIQGPSRPLVIEDLRQRDEQTREDRADRYLEVNQQGFIPNYYFAPASAECLFLYRDGYFIATVMTTQAVNEGILKFVAEQNSIQKRDYCNLCALLKLLVSRGIFSRDCFEASKQIYKSFRNDVHHMNPKVATIDFQELAKKNIHNLAVIEREIWGAYHSDEGLVPLQPEYWDKNPDGTVTISLRWS